MLVGRERSTSVNGVVFRFDGTAAMVVDVTVAAIVARFHIRPTTAACVRLMRYSLVNFLVSFQIALVTRRVIAARARVVFLPAMHRQMSFQQRFATKVASAMPTRVSGPVKYCHVIPQRGLAAELDSTTLEGLSGRLLVHGGHVAFQIVLPVGEIAALRATEKTLRHTIHAGHWLMSMGHGCNG